MKKYYIFLIGFMLITVSAYAYFGSSPFGQNTFGVSAFGIGAMDEEITESAFEAGDALLLEDGSSYLLLEDGTSKLLLET